jgi:cbb3-type cytochrome oxidase maturation protein
MSVIVLLIIAGGLVAAGFVVAFAWAVRSGQFDDITSAAIRMLFDEDHHGPSGPATPKPKDAVHAHSAR